MKAQPTQTPATNLKHDEIAARAYQIWEGAGRPVGSEIKHWLQAEEELRAAQNPKAGQSFPKPMQKANGQSADQSATETAKPEPKRQEAPVPQLPRRGQERTAATQGSLK